MLEESHLRCRWCSKRMWKEVDVYYFGAGTRWIHQCWSCEHAEAHIEPSRQSLTVVHGGRTGADRLKAVRLGDAG